MSEPNRRKKLLDLIETDPDFWLPRLTDEMNSFMDTGDFGRKRSGLSTPGLANAMAPMTITISMGGPSPLAEVL